MNIDAERDRLLALAEKATPGPWGLTGTYKNDPRGHYPVASCGNGLNDEHCGVEAPVQDYCTAAEDDANLIAAVPEMIALIRAQAAEIERLRGVCAATYQAAGVSDWPEPWLDILSDAANGDPLRHDPMVLLPFEATSDRDSVIEECAQVVDRRCEILTLAYRTAKSSHAEGRMDEADSCAAAIRALKEREAGNG